MLKIYHVAGTRSVRPIWLCYELNLSVDIETIDFSSSYRTSNEWQTISPTGKVPVLSDGDLTIFESGAMFNHILDKYSNGRFHPDPGSAASATYHQWCWFAEATLSRPVGLNRILRAEDEHISLLVEDAVQKFQKCLDTVDSALNSQEYILGMEFSAADIMIGSSLGFVEKLIGEKHSNTRKYLTRLKERKACQRAYAA